MNIKKYIKNNIITSVLFLCLLIIICVLIYRFFSYQEENFISKCAIRKTLEFTPPDSCLNSNTSPKELIRNSDIVFTVPPVLPAVDLETCESTETNDDDIDGIPVYSPSLGAAIAAANSGPATSPATSPATTTVTGPATTTVTGPGPSPATTTVTGPATSPATTTVTGPATSPATSPATTTVTGPATTPAITTVTGPATSPGQGPQITIEVEHLSENSFKIKWTNPMTTPIIRQTVYVFQPNDITPFRLWDSDNGSLTTTAIEKIATDLGINTEYRIIVEIYSTTTYKSRETTAKLLARGIILSGPGPSPSPGPSPGLSPESPIELEYLSENSFKIKWFNPMTTAIIKQSVSVFQPNDNQPFRLWDSGGNASFTTTTFEVIALNLEINTDYKIAVDIWSTTKHERLETTLRTLTPLAWMLLARGLSILPGPSIEVVDIRGISFKIKWFNPSTTGITRQRVLVYRNNAIVSLLDSNNGSLTTTAFEVFVINLEPVTAYKIMLDIFYGSNSIKRSETTASTTVTGPATTIVTGPSPGPSPGPQAPIEVVAINPITYKIKWTNPMTTPITRQRVYVFKPNDNQPFRLLDSNNGSLTTTTFEVIAKLEMNTEYKIYVEIYSTTTSKLLEARVTTLTVPGPSIELVDITLTTFKIKWTKPSTTGMTRQRVLVLEKNNNNIIRLWDSDNDSLNLAAFEQIAINLELETEYKIQVEIYYGSDLTKRSEILGKTYTPLAGPTLEILDIKENEFKIKWTNNNTGITVQKMKVYDSNGIVIRNDENLVPDQREHTIWNLSGTSSFKIRLETYYGETHTRSEATATTLARLICTPIYDPMSTLYDNSQMGLKYEISYDTNEFSATGWKVYNTIKMRVVPKDCPANFKEFELYRRMPELSGHNTWTKKFISEKHPVRFLTSNYNKETEILTVVCDINDLKKYLTTIEYINHTDHQGKKKIGKFEWDEYLRRTTITNNYGNMLIYSDLFLRAKDTGDRTIEGSDIHIQTMYLKGILFSLRFFAIAPNQEKNFISSEREATPTISITNELSYFDDNGQRISYFADNGQKFL